MRILRFSAPVMLICCLIFMSTCQLAGSNELQRPAYFQICNVWKEVVTMIAGRAVSSGSGTVVSGGAR